MNNIYTLFATRRQDYKCIKKTIFRQNDVTKSSLKLQVPRLVFHIVYKLIKWMTFCVTVVANLVQTWTCSQLHNAYLERLALLCIVLCLRLLKVNYYTLLLFFPIYSGYVNIWKHRYFLFITYVSIPGKLIGTCVDLYLMM